MRLRVLCCSYAGVLSALGLALADVVAEEQEPFAKQFAPSTPRARVSVACYSFSSFHSGTPFSALSGNDLLSGHMAHI